MLDLSNNKLRGKGCSKVEAVHYASIERWCSTSQPLVCVNLDLSKVCRSSRGVRYETGHGILRERVISLPSARPLHSRTMYVFISSIPQSAQARV